MRTHSSEPKWTRVNRNGPKWTEGTTMDQIIVSTEGSWNEDTHAALLLYANMLANFGSICNPIAHQPDGR